MKDDYYRDPDGFIVLEPYCSGLWKKKNYLAPVNSFFSKVFEYDIKQANVSVMRAFKILPDAVLDRLASIPKTDRNVSIGLLEKKDEYKHLKRDIARGIEYARHELFMANRLEDKDILSIKNDAVFILGRRLKQTKFGPIEFVLKNSYSMFHKIESTEFYYDSRTKIITAKGISDSVIETPDHQNGMLIFLRNVFDLLLRDNKDKLREYLIQFTDDYKSRRLPYTYYREMKSDNLYRSAMVLGDYAIHLDNITQEQVDKIDISYNYNYFVLPLLRLYLF